MVGQLAFQFVAVLFFFFFFWFFFSFLMYLKAGLVIV